MAIISKLKRWIHRFFASTLTRFTLLIFITLSVLLLLMNTFFLTKTRDMVFTSKQSLLQNQAYLIASSLTATDSLNVDNVTQVMELLDVTDITGIAIRDVSGDIYYDTISPVAGTISMHDVRVLTALDGSTGFYGHFNNGAFKCYYYMPLIMDEEIAGVLILYDFDTEQAAILLSLQSAVRLTTVLVTLIFVLIAIVLVYTISLRINTIRRGIAPVGDGDYTYRIGMKGSDEYAELANAFDNLTERLEKNETIRRRFVADASHELKTPIASIRLLSDSILQTENIDPDTTREFIGDIEHEAERLASITENLLTLTKLDNLTGVNRVPTDLSAVSAQAVHTLTPLAAARGIQLVLNAPDPCYVRAAWEELIHIVQNLAENAIKYNVENGMVWVSVLRDGNSVKLSVEDTGIGIPDESLELIFDRFYRVDKARSREAGGTGLGLSIVKDTAAILGGTVTAEHRQPSGTRFIAVFPACEPSPLHPYASHPDSQQTAAPDSDN